MGFLPKILIIWAFALNPRLFRQPLPRAPLPVSSSTGPCRRGDRDKPRGQRGPTGGVCRVSGRPWVGLLVWAEPEPPLAVPSPLPAHSSTPAGCGDGACLSAGHWPSVGHPQPPGHAWVAREDAPGDKWGPNIIYIITHLLGT